MVAGGVELLAGRIEQAKEPFPHLKMITVRHVESQELTGIRGFAQQGARRQYHIVLQSLASQVLGMQALG